MGENTSSAEKHTALWDALVGAWRQLYPDPEQGRPGDAAARAVLRRASTPSSVMMEPAFHALLQRMKSAGAEIGGASSSSSVYERLALAAALLAERRDPGSGRDSLMHVLGAAPQEKQEEEGRLKPLRFQALMAAMERGSGEEKMRTLRRALKLAAGSEFDVRGFARDLITWNDRTRLRWTFDYFRTHHAAASAAATDLTIAPEETPQ